MPPSRVVAEALEAFVRSGVASSRPEVLLWLGEDGMFDNATRYVEASDMEESVHSERKTKVDSLDAFIKLNARVIDVLRSKSSHRTMADCRLIEEIVHRSQALSAMLEGLSSRQLSIFLRKLQLIELHKGDTIVPQDQPATSLFVIIYGRVRACKGNDDPIFYERGHVVGELAWLFDDNARTELWQEVYAAASDCLLLKATRSHVMSAQSEEPWKEITETTCWALPSASEVEIAINMLSDVLPQDRARIHINHIARFLRSYAFFQQLPQSCVRAIARAATLHSEIEVGACCVLETLGKAGQSPPCGLQAASDKNAEFEPHSNCATGESMFFVLQGSVGVDDWFDDAELDENGTPCSRLFMAGDALVKSDLAPSSALDQGPVQVNVVVGPVHFACIAPDVFRRTVGDVLSSRSIIFPLASCLQILSQPLENRTKRDVNFLCQHVSHFGLGDRGVGGCFGQISLSDRRRLCRRFELQHARKGQPICVQGEPGGCYYMLITGSASAYMRESDENLSREGNSVYVSSDPASLTKRSGQQHFLCASLSDSDFDSDNKTEDCLAECSDNVADYDEMIGFKIGVLSPGDSVGERSLAVDAPCSVTVLANKDCLLLVLDTEGFDEMAEHGLILNSDVSLELANLAHDKRSPRVTRLLYNYLNSFPFFRMAGAACSLLLPGIRMVQYGERDAVFRQGQECEHFYAVGRGRIALFAAQRLTTPKSTGLSPGRGTPSKDNTDDDNCVNVACNPCLVLNAADVGLSGGETCIAIITAGEVFGCEGLLSQTSVARPHTAIALEVNTQLLEVRQDYVLEWHRQQVGNKDNELPAVRNILCVLQSRYVLRHVPCAVRTTEEVCLVLAALREQHLFEQFNEKIMREVCKCGWAHRVSRGELIWRQGKAAGRQQQRLVCFILQGTVALYHDLDVRQVPHRTLDRILDSSYFDYRADPAVGLCWSMRALHEFSAKASSFAELDTYGARMGYGKCLAILEAGDSFGEQCDDQGNRALRTATLVAREATDLLVLSEAQFDRIFEIAHVPSSHMRPSLLKARLAQLDDLQYQHQRHRPINNQLVSSTQNSLQKAVCLYPVLRRSLYTELLRCAASFRDVADAELETLLPYVQCQLYSPGEVVLEPSSEVVSIFLLLFGVVEMFANETENRDNIGQLTVGNQFGHLPLLWNEAVNPVGYRARSTVLCAMVDRAAYCRYWHTLYDADEVKLATYLREMPLLRSLSLYDVLCIRARLERIDLTRGAIKRDCDMADDVYFIFTGECRLLAFREGYHRCDAQRVFGQMPRAATVAAAGEQVATLGRFNTFCDSSHSTGSLALYAASATTVLRCSLAYLKQNYPALLDTIYASTELMLEWSFINVLRRDENKSVTKDIELVEDGRQLVRKMLFEQSKSSFPSSMTTVPSVLITSIVAPAKSLASYKRRRLLLNESVGASEARRPRDFLHPIKSNRPRDLIHVAPASTSFNSSCLTLNQAKRLIAKDQGTLKSAAPPKRSGVVRRAENTRQATRPHDSFIADPIAYYRAAQSAISTRAFIPLPTLPRLYKHRRLISPRHSALTPLMV